MTGYPTAVVGKRHRRWKLKAPSFVEHKRNFLSIKDKRTRSFKRHFQPLHISGLCGAYELDRVAHIVCLRIPSKQS